MNLEKALNIGGWMELDELEWIANMASTSHSIVEVGAYKGRATRAMVDNTKANILVIDPWDGEYYYEDGRPFEFDMRVLGDFADNLEDVLKTGQVIALQQKFSEADDGNLCDFIFLDGDHRYEMVKNDIEHAKRICKGIIAGHDYTTEVWPGVKLAVDEIFGKKVILGPGSIWSMCYGTD